MVNNSPRRHNDHGNDNQSVDAIYQSTAFDLVNEAGSDRANF